MSLDHNELIEGFFRSELSEEQTILFQELMKSDLEFQEKVMFEKELFETLDPEGWSFLDEKEPNELNEYKALFESEEVANLKNIINSSRDKFQDKPSRSRAKWYLYASAAVVALMISIFAWLNGNPSSTDLYERYMDTSELPSLVERGEETNDALVQAQQLFEQGSYAKSIEILEKELPSTQKNVSTVYIYKGIAEMQLNEFDAALVTFDGLIQSDLLDASKGLWYKALIYLKTDRKQEAEAILKELVESKGYKSDKASQLLKEI